MKLEASSALRMVVGDILAGGAGQRSRFTPPFNLFLIEMA